MSNFVRMKRIKHIIGVGAALLFLLLGCGSGRSGSAEGGSTVTDAGDIEEGSATTEFDADSAYLYVKRQVKFGPRVPNSEAHRRAGDWLVGELKRHGAKVTEQSMRLRAFDGTMLNTRNILGQYNPEARERILLLAHWDCRPWADEDPDESKRKMPVDGANDGASGVGVLLEIARQMGMKMPSKGVDILFVDAEDWGSEGDDDTWALGTQEFVSNPPIKNYAPKEAILLDMVGGEDATFYREYFSERSASGLNSSLWKIADELGYGESFPNRPGGAVNDDHLRLIEAGIPAVDIIEYRPGESGFNPRWHTSKDNMEGISTETLGKVGKVVMTYLRRRY